MKKTIITSILSVTLTLLICSGILNFYQFSQRKVYSCIEGYDKESRDQMQELINNNPGMNLKGIKK